MIEITHLIPPDDSREHETDIWKPCWCCPSVDRETGLIFHNSADGREAYEIGTRLPH